MGVNVLGGIAYVKATSRVYIIRFCGLIVWAIARTFGPNRPTQSANKTARKCFTRYFKQGKEVIKVYIDSMLISAAQYYYGVSKGRAIAIAKQKDSDYKNDIKAVFYND